MSKTIVLEGVNYTVPTAGDSNWAKNEVDFKNAVASSLNTKISSGSSEDWIEVGSGGTAPAFGTNWANSGGTYETLAFYKDPLDVVHLKGLISHSVAGSGSIFTLPVGYRPSKSKYFNLASTSGTSTALIYSTGVVAHLSGTYTNVGLDGITFRV